MRAARRVVVALSLVLLVLSSAATAHADETTAIDASAAVDNSAIAVNTHDGATVFRLAFSVRKIADDVVAPQNAAVAYASCVDCRTIALAFQVVLVEGSPTTEAPQNLALAYNNSCTGCTTYAAATQIVLPIDGPAKLTAEGERRLQELRHSLRDLARQADTITVEELNSKVEAANAELLAIFTTQLVPAGASGASGANGADASTTSTTSTTSASSSSTSTTTSTTTSDGVTTTTTTSTPGGASTTSTTSGA